jgi:hypothetical protein
VAVTDTGRGIATSEQTKVFDYLYQVEHDPETDHRGLGIGLHICKELVLGHGGRIWVRSHGGHGSTFFFTPPVFSLEGQLASIVEAADLVTHSIAVITVEVSHVEDSPLGQPDQPFLQDVWDALQSCSIPNLVVLLPTVPHTLSRELFFVVACANQSSAEVLVEQLRNRLLRCHSQQLRDGMARRRSLQGSAALRSDISFILLDTPSKRDGVVSEEPMNEALVDQVEDLMKTALGKGGGDLYEWAQSSHRG